MEVVLASMSPRRVQLLQLIVDKFIICPPNVNEDICYDNPIQLVEKLSHLKASQVALEYPLSLVIGADTIVLLDSKVLNKPTSSQEAYDMLSSLSGKWHYVYTGVSLIYGQMHCSFVEETKVKFRNLTKFDISNYIESGSCMDKAGAYGIQDNDFVSQIIGSRNNVMGLPTEQLSIKLNDFCKQIINNKAVY